ncbi:MAG: hypothetical protein HON65_07760 [Rhodospirillales bacterium]|nr:hypothetical protein [Rhodospirillales bacterium]
MNKYFSRILTVSASVLALIPLFALQAYADGFGMMSHHGEDMGWGHMLFGSLMMILLFGGLLFVIAFAVRWINGNSAIKTNLTNERTAMDILNERFARGEIEKEDYEERKRILSE